MKKIKKVLSIYLFFFLLSAIVTACCKETYRIVGGGVITARNLQTGEIFEESTIGVIKNPFRIDWEIETTNLSGLNLIQSTYASSCDQNYENDWDITSFKVTTDREFILNGNTIQPGSNLIEIDELVHTRTYFGASVTFDEQFLNNTEFSDQIYEFKFEMKTTDGLKLEKLIKLKFEL
ncbi:hypothetical protein [Fulvivirga ligni]|uniref:hypothetical protein n=1 Tax=Fulvivirga ligni TaxID=2904246 RepID=UPI001F249DB7|nr:hypothetical protein [Fulvivirga ligni]UII20531.1 hypothetical protein LVD16_22075 [Fulvivirga ligni]